MRQPNKILWSGTLIGTMWLVASCSSGITGASGGALSAAKAASGQSANASGPSPSTASDGPALGSTNNGTAQDAGSGSTETETANQPQPVSGSFLTMACASATATDGAAPQTGESAFGCTVRNQDGSRYANVRSVTNVTAGLSGTPNSIAPRTSTPSSDSQFHFLFYMNGAYGQRMTSVSAVVDYGASTPALVSTQTTPSCSTQRNQSTISSLLPFTMDAQNALPVLLGGRGGNGGAPRSIFTEHTLAPGDILNFESGSGLAFYTVNPNTTPPTADSRSCTSGYWRIYFKNASGSILNLPTAANQDGVGPVPAGPSSEVTNFAETIVPDGTVSASIGFYEPTASYYLDNEGNPALAATPPAGSTGGCTFNFEWDQTQCSL